MIDKTDIDIAVARLRQIERKGYNPHTKVTKQNEVFESLMAETDFGTAKAAWQEVCSKAIGG